MAMESKMDIYNLMPLDVRPKTLLAGKGSDYRQLIREAGAIGIEFPFIVNTKGFHTPIDELAAAAAELISDSAEVTGYYIGDADWEANVWTDMRPKAKTWSFGVEVTSGAKPIIGVDNDLFNSD